MLSSSVCNQCLDRSNLRSPHTTLHAIILTSRGLVFTFCNGIIASTTAGCTIGNTTNYVGYVWWNSCSFYSRCKVVSGLNTQINENSRKRTGFVTSAIARCHTCRLLPVGPSEGHSLLEKSVYVGRSLAFDSSGYDNSTTRAWNLSAYKEFLTSQGPVIYSN